MRASIWPGVDSGSFPCQNWPAMCWISGGDDGGLDNKMANSFVGAVVMLCILMLIITAYLLTRMSNTIGRAWKQHPTSRGLWFCVLLIVGGMGVAVGAGLATQAGVIDQQTGQTIAGVGGALALLGIPLMWLIAGAVLVWEDETIRPEPETLVTSVFHRPWWKPMQES